MKRYIAYFDYLGFKDFIKNNNEAHLNRRTNDLLRDVEQAISQGQNRQVSPGILVADLDKIKVNCLTISDTVIFWSEDDSDESRDTILSVAYKFNLSNLYTNMPARGTVCYSTLDIKRGNHVSSSGLFYIPNLIYGKGLVEAHEEAESLDWAGCIINQTVTDEIKRRGLNAQTILEPYAKLYNVPHKNGSVEEYAMKIVDGTLSAQAFVNFRKSITAVFEADNKDTSDPRVKKKLSNTIDYLSTFQ